MKKLLSHSILQFLMMLMLGFSSALTFSEDGGGFNEGVDSRPFSISWVDDDGVEKSEGFCFLRADGRTQCLNKKKKNFQLIGDSRLNIQEVALGGAHTCAISESRKLYCWGDDSDDETKIPDELAKEKTRSVFLGYYHTCAISESGKLYCWGDDSDDETKIPDELAHEKTRSVSLGVHYTCAINESGNLYCWGNNTHNQTEIPEELAREKTRSVFLGYYHTCAISESGKLYCWGNNRYGQTEIPEELAREKIRNVALGSRHTCAISESGKLYCWGYSREGATRIPWELAGEKTRSVALGGNHTCAINESGKLYCWGRGYHHYLQNEIPKELASEKTRSVSLGSNHSCAISESGNLYCWGENNQGETEIPNVFTFKKEYLESSDLNSPAIAKYLNIHETQADVASFGELNCVLQHAKSQLYCVWQDKEGKIVESERINLTAESDYDFLKRAQAFFQPIRKKLYKFDLEFLDKYLEHIEGSALSLSLFNDLLNGIEDSYTFSDAEKEEHSKLFQSFTSDLAEGRSWLPGYFRGSLAREVSAVGETQLRRAELFEVLKLLEFLIENSRSMHPKRHQPRIEEILREAQSHVQDFKTWNKTKIKSIQSFLKTKSAWLHEEVYENNKYLSARRPLLQKIRVLANAKILDPEAEQTLL